MWSPWWNKKRSDNDLLSHKYTVWLQRWKTNRLNILAVIKLVSIVFSRCRNSTFYIFSRIYFFWQWQKCVLTYKSLLYPASINHSIVGLFWRCVLLRARKSVQQHTLRSVKSAFVFMLFFVILISLLHFIFHCIIT